MGLVTLMLVCTAKAFADDVYFLDKMPGCLIQKYSNSKFTTVDSAGFNNVILNVKKLPKNPQFVAFKFSNELYVTKEICVMSTNKEAIDNHLIGNEYKRKVQVVSEKDKFNSYKYFVEIESGFINMLDSSSVASDYNEIMPNSSTNPTVWGEPSDSDYTAGALVSLGFGFRNSHHSFIAFKLRVLNGVKSDPVSLIDVNTSLEEAGNWTYEDSFTNLYGGYKYIFRDYSAWKPILAAYLGVSKMNSTMSNGSDSYELSSFGLAALFEVGIEYHINSHVGIGANLGFEYLGNRTMKFADESNGSEFKTNVSYNNQYLSLGVKYYF